ncbi:MAG: hypothetical protein ACRBN8_30065 [Nannocystales bacterium]
MSHDDALDALIATAKAQDLPPPGAEDQAWAAFAGSLDGGGGGGSDLPGAAEVAGAKGVGLALKVAGGVVLASVAAVGVARWSTPSEVPSVEPHVSAEPVLAETAAIAPERAVMPAVDVAPVAPVAAPERAPVPVSPASRAQITSAPAPAPVVARPSASTLAEEARSVGSMWKALDRGDAKRALSIAQAHGVRFKGGALGLEARGAALAARCVLGRPTDLRELEVVTKTAAPAVAKRISSACTKKP